MIAPSASVPTPFLRANSCRSVPSRSSTDPSANIAEAIADRMTAGETCVRPVCAPAAIAEAA